MRQQSHRSYQTITLGDGLNELGQRGAWRYLLVQTVMASDATSVKQFYDGQAMDLEMLINEDPNIVIR